MSVVQFSDFEFAEAEYGESILGTLTAPTFTLSTDTSLGLITIQVTNAGVVPDFNEVYRYRSGEIAICLTRSLPAGGTFYDYNVASGVVYFYYVRAVQTGSSYADSAVSSTIVTFTSNLMHLVAKNAASNRLETYGTIVIPLMAPVTRTNDRDAQELIEPARTKSVVATSQVVNRAYTGTMLFAGYPNSIFTSLQTMYDARRVFCVRDVDSHLIFGTMTVFTTSYQHTYLQVELAVDETDFVENVAA